MHGRGGFGLCFSLGRRGRIVLAAAGCAIGPAPSPRERGHGPLAAMVCMNRTKMGLVSACLAVASWLRSGPARAEEAQLSYDASAAPVAFAAGDLEAALRARGYEARHSPLEEAPREAAAAPLRIVLLTREQALERLPSLRAAAPELAALRPEGFALRWVGRGKPRELWVVGADVAGELYGGLELAEQIRTLGVDRVKPLAKSPYMPVRGTKLNIPLDVRTPSYSDMSDSAQAAIADVWDFGFWRDYLDHLARSRYNLVSLWSEHPFPSLVRVPEYPAVALADVLRSKIDFQEDYATTGVGLVTPKMLAHVEVVRKLTIDEKIDFFRRVMQYAKDRNIELYLMTWNIFTYGVGGKYGITEAIDNPRTVDYFRASVRAAFRTYPLLRGIGVTTGENMGRASFEAKEAWAFATYGQGTLDAARAEPGRRIRFIHRQHQTRAQDIAKTFQPLLEQPNVDFVFSFKYAQAHALSTPRQLFHLDFVKSLGSMKTLWTLRNDDALMFRWAAPEFVRDFVRNIPYEQSAGYYFGSDMWVWAREFLDKEPTTPRQLEVDKHWLHFLLWGRLGYDPSLDDERIAALVADRFAGVDARGLLDAWDDASIIYPLVTGFHWGEFDFQWYIEGCRSRPGPAQTRSGFHDVNRFITLGVHPGTDNVPIPEYVDRMLAGRPMVGTSPPEVASRIAQRAAAALSKLERLRLPEPAERSLELSRTLGDIVAMARLGQYYAEKIRGATELALFRRTAERTHQTQATTALEEAARYWRLYTAQASAQYRNPLWTNRVGLVDFRELTAEVDADIAIARRAKPSPRN